MITNGSAILVTVNKLGTLTKDDLHAMRRCDSVSFHHGAGLERGQSSIRCTKQVRHPKPFEDRERSHEIACLGSVRYFKSDDAPRSEDNRYNCFAMRHHGQSDEWQTIANILKVGDVVSLEWVGCDNNGYLRDTQGVKLHHDHLSLVVKRGDKRRMVFHVDDSICPNNTARMVRPL